MTSIASPNGLAVAGALFMLAGLAILGAMLLNKAILAKLDTTFDTPAKLAVAGWFGLPMLALGLFMQAAGNIAPVTMGPGLSLLLLALAFALGLYVMLDETIADSVSQRASQPSADPQAAALPAPVLEAISEATKASAADVPKIALVS